MDPLSQGVVGASFSLLHGRKMPMARIALMGALGGMAPDLDVLIRSTEDPLLALQFHRHFTHSLLFIPVGALLCALALYPLIAKRWRMSFGSIYWPVFLGYATHALLDVCTSYGTQIFWPFSQYRASIDIVSVIDPLFTVPILLMIIVAVIRSSRLWVYLAIAWGAFYLSVGALQNMRAKSLGWELAKTRGHQPTALDAKPSFGNILVWKTVYEYQDRFYVDAVKAGFKHKVVWEGDSIAKLDVKRDFPWLSDQSQQAKDIERFRWFSEGFVAVYPEGSSQIADIRYSMLPNQIKPLWAIQLNEDAQAHGHVKYRVNREKGRESLPLLWSMITAKTGTAHEQ